MARLTLDDLIRRAHQMADIPRPSTSRTDASVGINEITDVLNDGLAELHDLLVGTFEDWLTTKTDLATVASTETVLLPSDFYKLRRLFKIEGGQRVQLDPFDFEDMLGTTRTDTSDRPYWRVMNTHLYLNPLPAAAYTLEAWYVRAFNRLEDAGAELSPELPNGWEAFPIAYAAAYMLTKEERDPQVALLQMERARDRIESAARSRGSVGPRSVRDVRGRFGNKHRFPIPRI